MPEAFEEGLTSNFWIYHDDFDDDMAESKASKGEAGKDEQQEYSFGNPPPMGNPFTGGMVGTGEPPSQFLPLRHFRGSSLAQTFNMRERLKRPEPMLGFGLGMPSSEVAR